MMTVTGALIVFATLPGDSVGRSLSLAFSERIKIKRAGPVFALVGPHFARLYSWRRVSSLIARLSHTFGVRASRNKRSNASSVSFSMYSPPYEWVCRRLALHGHCRNNLQFVPVLNNPAPFVDAEDFDSSPVTITGPMLNAMKH